MTLGLHKAHRCEISELGTGKILKASRWKNQSYTKCEISYQLYKLEKGSISSKLRKNIISCLEFNTEPKCQSNESREYRYDQT